MKTPLWKSLIFFYDLDEVMEENLKMPVSNFVWRYWWEAFREKEYRFLSQLLLIEEKKVISLWWWTVIFERNRDILKINQNNILIFIDCSIQIMGERIWKDQQNWKRRNSLTGNNIIEELEYVYEERISYYSSLYNYKFINTKTPEDCIKNILETIPL